MNFRLKKDLYKDMLFSRLLDEKLISIFKKGKGYFWVGAPGEEAIGVSLGKLVRKGKGIHSDWLHLHYRCTGTIMAMGVQTKDVLRMMLNKKTDPFTQGKNFIHHYCIPEWNIPPISSTIEIQHNWALGTAHVQSKESQTGITIVTGGDAGTALGDFSTALVWSSRPVRPLPLLMIVLNNHWGISTPYKDQHGEESIARRAEAFQIKNYSVNGNCALESYQVLKEAIDYVRISRKPALVEAQVSRLYGHSSSSGAGRVLNEECSLKNFENRLLKEKVLSSKEIQEMKKKFLEKLSQEYEEVIKDPEPQAQDIWDHIYAHNETANWRDF